MLQFLLRMHLWLMFLRGNIIPAVTVPAALLLLLSLLLLQMLLLLLSLLQQLLLLLRLHYYSIVAAAAVDAVAIDFQSLLQRKSKLEAATVAAQVKNISDVRHGRPSWRWRTTQ
jgi:hypothetical protein